MKGPEGTEWALTFFCGSGGDQGGMCICGLSVGVCVRERESMFVNMCVCESFREEYKGEKQVKKKIREKNTLHAFQANIRDHREPKG